MQCSNRFVHLKICDHPVIYVHFTKTLIIGMREPDIQIDNTTDGMLLANPMEDIFKKTIALFYHILFTNVN